MQSDHNGKYVTLIDAAQIVGISPTTLNRWAQDGRIPSVVTKAGGRLLLKAGLDKVAVNAEDPPPPEA